MGKTSFVRNLDFRKIKRNLPSAYNMYRKFRYFILWTFLALEMCYHCFRNFKCFFFKLKEENIICCGIFAEILVKTPRVKNTTVLLSVKNKIRYSNNSSLKNSESVMVVDEVDSTISKGSCCHHLWLMGFFQNRSILNGLYCLIWEVLSESFSWGCAEIKVQNGTSNIFFVFSN